jgi:hypothetical protein
MSCSTNDIHHITVLKRWAYPAPLMEIRHRSRSNKGHYGMRHTTLWSCISLTYLERQKCYGPDNKKLLKKKIIWPWGQRSRSHKGHYGTHTHTVLWSCTHIPNIIDLSRKTKNVMARTRKYYLKNNYLTFMLKVKVQRRSLRWSNNCFFRDRSMIFGMWVHVHKAVCRIP